MSLRPGEVHWGQDGIPGGSAGELASWGARTQGSAETSYFEPSPSVTLPTLSSRYLLTPVPSHPEGQWSNDPPPHPFTPTR